MLDANFGPRYANQRGGRPLLPVPVPLFSGLLPLVPVPLPLVPAPVPLVLLLSFPVRLVPDVLVPGAVIPVPGIVVMRVNSSRLSFPSLSVSSVRNI
jgi:hypothetical protein